MYTKRKSYHIIKCELGGLCILNLFEGVFFGDHGIQQTLDVVVHVLYVVGKYPR